MFAHAPSKKAVKYYLKYNYYCFKIFSRYSSIRASPSLYPNSARHLITSASLNCIQNVLPSTNIHSLGSTGIPCSPHTTVTFVTFARSLICTINRHISSLIFRIFLPLYYFIPAFIPPFA